MNVDIHIIEDRCKGCLICIELCQADVLEQSDRTNTFGYPFPVVAHIERCVDCGMCEMFCPDFALWVSSHDEKIESEKNE
jgi:2-oxoglutarate ferredoxin oxidoreductase subunit delta